MPFAEGGFPTPSGRCELRSDSLAAAGLDPLAGYVPPREGPTSAPELARRFPLAFISPPAHHFLNSTFSAQPVFVRREGEPSVTLHPEDARARGIAEGDQVRVFNDRGSFLARARVSEAARPGLVVGLSIWWPKMCPGGRNVNAVTSQELTDMGGGATFYDVLVEVAGNGDSQRHRAGVTPASRCQRLVGAYMAATVIVRSLQYLRLRDRRLLPLAALFAFQVAGPGPGVVGRLEGRLPGRRLRGGPAVAAGPDAPASGGGQALVRSSASGRSAGGRPAHSRHGTHDHRRLDRRATDGAAGGAKTRHWHLCSKNR